MKKEPILDYIRRRLAETKGRHNQIAKASGVPQSTISRVYKGCNPRVETAQRLADYFERQERRSRRINPSSAGADPVPLGH